MKIREITQNLDEAEPSKSYCKNTPNDEMSASWLASCKSRGLVARTGGKSHKIGKRRVKVGGKKIKGKEHGGPLPDWS
jgi:hypothetical protein